MAVRASRVASDCPARGRRAVALAALVIAALMPLSRPVGAQTPPRPAAVDCAPDRLSIATAAGPQSFRVELADTPHSRATGLMGRRDLAPDAGMLFLYEMPRGALFWMKDTPLPLDMIFADSRGVITHIHENARPFDETPIDGGDAVLAVLELNGGTAARLGLAVGQAMAHPALPQDAAAWPCAR